jgi:cytoskeletal protein RodZ
MIEFGKTLRLAREAKGYSVSQLAEMTRMIHQTIEDLENENFTRIAAPIYGRGFVKLYCEAVGLDPKPMIAEFMEIFSGNRELGIKERVPAPEPKLNSEPETVSAPESADGMKSISEIKPEIKSVGLEEAAPLPEPVSSEPPPSNLFTAAQVANPTPPLNSEAAKPRESRLSRYAAPIREASLPSIPPSFWRIATLAVGALVILWILGLGFKALYKATSGAADAGGSAIEETVQPPESASEAKNAQAPAVTTGSEKVEVPPLYVD